MYICKVYQIKDHNPTNALGLKKSIYTFDKILYKNMWVQTQFLSNLAFLVTGVFAFSDLKKNAKLCVKVAILFIFV